MDNWLKEEIEAAKRRKERTESKLSRRELDAQAIATGKEKYWTALIESLRSAVEQINDAGVCDDPITIDEKNTYLYIRTPGYPNHQLVLQFRDGSNDIVTNLRKFDSTISTGNVLVDEVMNFDVNDDGHIVLRGKRSMMDVSQATEYFMKLVLSVIYSGR